MPFPPPDPIIFSFDLLGGIVLTLRWYGVLAAVGILVGTLIADREIGRHGGRTEVLWDSLLWIVPAGVIGARIWYVLNDILGGSSYFTDDLIRILQIQNGGLHIFGAILGGLLAAVWYLRRERFDVWLFLDAMAPSHVGWPGHRPSRQLDQPGTLRPSHGPGLGCTDRSLSPHRPLE